MSVLTFNLFFFKKKNAVSKYIIQNIFEKFTGNKNNTGINRNKILRTLLFCLKLKFIIILKNKNLNQFYKLTSLIR